VKTAIELTARLLDVTVGEDKRALAVKNDWVDRKDSHRRLAKSLAEPKKLGGQIAGQR
jgi:hypothetical protein